jgi:hypothetical protein
LLARYRDPDTDMSLVKQPSVPVVDMLLPSLAIARTDIELPRAIDPNALRTEPTRNALFTDREVPMRLIARSDTLLPSTKKSSTVILDPTRVPPNAERVEPTLVSSVIDAKLDEKKVELKSTLPATLPAPAAEIDEPSLEYWRRDMAELRSQNPSTVTESPKKTGLNTDIIEPSRV